MSQEVPTRQWMFDRAYRGLASQGFEPARGKDGRCVYMQQVGDGVVRRCAWGWVDPDETPGACGTVKALRSRKLGVAALLTDELEEFACQLQQAHDGARGGGLAFDLGFGPWPNAAKVRDNLKRLAAHYGLSVPELDGEPK